MDQIMTGLIEEKLKVLINQPLLDIGRASNLLWLSFGERVVTINRKGNEIQKGKYALNVQCAWRLTQNSRIIVASKDIYLPKTGLEYDSFNWEEYGNNRFDERISSFKIDFEFGVKFELFPDDSLEEEFWRFIINGNKSEHFVYIDKEE